MDGDRSDNKDTRELLPLVSRDLGSDNAYPRFQFVENSVEKGMSNPKTPLRPLCS